METNQLKENLRLILRLLISRKHLTKKLFTTYAMNASWFIHKETMQELFFYQATIATRSIGAYGQEYQIFEGVLGSILTSWGFRDFELVDYFDIIRNTREIDEEELDDVVMSIKSHIDSDYEDMNKKMENLMSHLPEFQKYKLV